MVDCVSNAINNFPLPNCCTARRLSACRPREAEMELAPARCTIHPSACQDWRYHETPDSAAACCLNAVAQSHMTANTHLSISGCLADWDCSIVLLRDSLVPSIRLVVHCAVVASLAWPVSLSSSSGTPGPQRPCCCRPSSSYGSRVPSGWFSSRRAWGELMLSFSTLLKRGMGATCQHQISSRLRIQHSYSC